jgi:Ribbon-helix-helix protein, copG family
MSSTLDRRVQILIDPAQYEQIEREAARTHQSVAAVIRDAIAARLSASDLVRETAAARLLASADSVNSAGEDWLDAKEALSASLASKLP